MLNSTAFKLVARWISSPSRMPAASCLMMAVSAGVAPRGSVDCRAFSCGSKTAIISSGLVTGVAPWRISALQPALIGLVMLPGTTKTSLPCASACAAVLSVPLRAAASVMRIASASPLTRRLRVRKLHLPTTYGLGSSMQCSDKIAPPCAMILSPSARLAAG